MASMIGAITQPRAWGTMTGQRYAFAPSLGTPEHGVVALFRRNTATAPDRNHAPTAPFRSTNTRLRAT